MNKFMIKSLALCTFSCCVAAQTQTTSEDPAFTILRDNPQPVSTHFYGQGYWSWVDQWGGHIYNTEPIVAELNLDTLRMGGINNDNSEPEPFTKTKIDESIAYADAIGAEPLFQLPTLKDWNGNEASVKSAMEIVKYMNGEKNFHVKYFSIGNEPDYYVAGGYKDSSYTPEDTCNLFAKISDAVKAYDPDTVILGPDFAYNNTVNPWLKPFVENCKGKFDVFTMHRYPFHPLLTTKFNVLNDEDAYRYTLRKMRDYLDEHGLQDIPLAITETNVTWDGDPDNVHLAGSPGTFLAALWAADILGVSLEEKLWNLSFWSLSEEWDISFLNVDDLSPKPVYYVLQLFSQHFGDQVLQVENNVDAQGISVYAGEDSASKNVTLAVINKSDEAKTYRWAIKDSNYYTRVFERTFPALSLTFLIQTPTFDKPQAWQYTQAMADKALPPQPLQ
ncbi:glycosyl hydrolase [Vibrio quintilis]|uniref:Asl1-like glycosyl hydrolase catalytic domain-containing protein n=1 Tax=Vibrio quintilis TaxID=1117707 RepID=A0A1M7YXV6_9VIBR|nr:glycosyl hydrolase [Vibrio quintilis]SHO57517.1 hypothetical protein VQ7734_03287 [Vibrio quintilis]